MKKSICLLVIMLLAVTRLFSQNIDDALRYSRVFNSGTARFVSMGGAFTALGADLSAIGLNPAGTGVFRSFGATITPELLYNNTTSTFNNSSSDDFKYSLGLSQAGVVANIISHGTSSGLVNLNFAYSFQKTNNYNENLTIKGIGEQTSMAEYWAARSEGIYYKNLTGPEGIAYDVWVMDTIRGTSGSSYGTIFQNYGDGEYVFGQTIRRLVANEGYSSEHSLSIGANFSEKYFLGATLTINHLNYTGHYEHLEADYENKIYDFKNFVYTDHLEAKGNGFSLKLGTIIRPTEMLRIGASIHTPVIYKIREYYYDQISSEFDDGMQYSAQNEPMRYSYTLTTPFKATAGVALQFKKLAIVSLDYEFTDYRIARLSKGSDGYNYYDENQTIKNSLKPASNIKLGTEFRFGNLYARGGFAFYESAFAGSEINKGLNYSSLSLGAGFRQQNFFIDIAFVNFTSSMKYMMYFDPGYLEPATINTARNTFSVTLGSNF